MLTQPKVAPVGKRDSAFNSKADSVSVVGAGKKIDEIVYNFKVMTINSDCLVDDKRTFALSFLRLIILISSAYPGNCTFLQNI